MRWTTRSSRASTPTAAAAQKHSAGTPSSSASSFFRLGPVPNLKTLGVSVPGLQGGQRVDRVAAVVPPGCGPDLEVEVARGCVACVADHSDLLAGEDLVALRERARLGQVHVRVVDAVDPVDHQVVAGG